MRYMAAITMLVLAVAIAQPVAAQGFKPDYNAGEKAYKQKDYATALRHFRPLAKQGDVVGQWLLGHMYRYGYGLTKGQKEAARWYRLVAKRGEVLGQTSLADMYSLGNGVIQHYMEAVRWYRLAAKQGDTYAQYWLGYMYRNGLGVVQDLVMAYVWFNVAAASGDSPAASSRDDVQKELNRADLNKAKDLSRLCHEKPAKCPEYSDD